MSDTPIYDQLVRDRIAQEVETRLALVHKGWWTRFILYLFRED